MSTTQKSALKEALTEILSCALEPNSEIQRLAEERKKALEMTEEYPFLLIEIMDSDEEAEDEKVMAAIFLKNYLSDWTKEENPQHMMLNYDSCVELSLSILDVIIKHSKLRPMTCGALTYLVYIGMWQSIDNKVMSMLQSESENSLCAAVFFLNYLFDEISCDDIEISPEYFEALLNIFQRCDNATLRADIVNCTLCILSHSFQDLASTLDGACRLGKLFDMTLREPYSESNNFFVKSEIIRGLLMKLPLQDTSCSVYDGEICRNIVVPCLPAIGQLVIHCCHEYKQILMETRQIPTDKEEDLREPKNFYDLIIHIQELVNRLIDNRAYFPLLMDGLDDLLYCLFIFMSAPNTCLVFATDIEDQPANFDIREGALQSLTTIMCHLHENPTFFKSLHNVFMKHVTECTAQRETCPAYYAKILESLMFGMGTLRNFFPQSTIFARDEVFPHRYYLETWNTLLLNESNYAIIGRILWLGGKYSASLNSSTLELQIKTIIKYFDADDCTTEPLYEPLSKALNYHIAAYQHSPIENRMVFKNLANDIARCVLKMTQMKSVSAECYLNALGHLYKDHFETMRHYTSNTINFVVSEIKSHLASNQLMKEVYFLIGALAKHELNRDIIESNLRPLVMKMVYNFNRRESKAPPTTLTKTNTQERGFELLNCIILHSPQPINDVIVHESFYSAVNIILNSNEATVDDNTIEAAVDLIIMMLIKLSPQLKNLTTEKGEPFFDLVPKIIFELLDPAKSVWTVKVGKLCVTSIMTLNGKMEQHLESILKSLLSYVLVNTDMKTIEAAWLIFTYIFMYKPADTTNFLSSVPGPTGGSALAYLIDKWRPHYFAEIGRFETKIIAVAITQIIAYAIEENNEKINEVKIKLMHKETQKEFSGIEYMYILLVQILLDSVNKTVNVGPSGLVDDEEDQCLFKTLLPFSNISMENHIKGFLKTSTPYYYNVVRNYFDENDSSKLSSLGLLPELME